MATRCPYCSKQAVPLWKKFIMESKPVRYTKCQSCGKLLVLSDKWLTIYVLSLIAFFFAAVLLTYFSVLPMQIGIKLLVVYCIVTIPFFIIMVPLKPYK